MSDFLLNSTSPSPDDQEVTEGEKPPDPSPRPARPWRVAVIANVKGETSLPIHSPQDAGAEFDRKETIQAIQAAIESDGHSTIFLQADASLPFKLSETCPDICFNIAEGAGGDAREAQVPALLEMLHIPYTASRVLANALALDKTMTKHIWSVAGLPTALFQEFSQADDPLDEHMTYPMFVKPAREGTGMGMGSESIVYDEAQLRRRVAWVIKEYAQPALVEEYLPGREFTVAVLGRRQAQQGDDDRRHGGQDRAIDEETREHRQAQSRVGWGSDPLAVRGGLRSLREPERLSNPSANQDGSETRPTASGPQRTCRSFSPRQARRGRPGRRKNAG